MATETCGGDFVLLCEINFVAVPSQVPKLEQNTIFKNK